MNFKTLCTKIALCCSCVFFFTSAFAQKIAADYELTEHIVTGSKIDTRELLMQLIRKNRTGFRTKDTTVYYSFSSSLIATGIHYSEECEGHILAPEVPFSKVSFNYYTDLSCKLDSQFANNYYIYKKRPHFLSPIRLRSDDIADPHSRNWYELKHFKEKVSVQFNGKQKICSYYYHNRLIGQYYFDEFNNIDSFSYSCYHVDFIRGDKADSTLSIPLYTSHYTYTKTSPRLLKSMRVESAQINNGHNYVYTYTQELIDYVPEQKIKVNTAFIPSYELWEHFCKQL